LSHANILKALYLISKINTKYMHGVTITPGSEHQARTLVTWLSLAQTVISKSKAKI
jgi:hypothetical protein